MLNYTLKIKYCNTKLYWVKTFNVLTGSMVRGPIIILGFTTSPAIIGYFAFASRLIELPFNAIRTGLRSYVLPVMAKRSEVGQDIGPLITHLTFATTFLMFPVFIIISALAPPFITLLFDGNWDAAIPIFKFIGILGGLKFFFLYHGIALVALGKAKIGVWFEISNAAGALILIFFLTPIYGLGGVVIALVVNLIFDFVIKIYSLTIVIDYDIKVYICNALKLLNSGLIMFILLLINPFRIGTNIYISTFIAIVLGVTAYVGSLITMKFSYKQYITQALNK